MTYTCRFCGLICQHKPSVSRHVKIFHPSKVVPPVRTCSLLCTVCRKYFKSKKEFVMHLPEFHNVLVSQSAVTMNFDSLQEFRAWKTEMEQQTGALYKSSRGKACNKDTQVLYFECNRSGHYKTEGQGLRKPRDSVKIGGFCPSEIKVRVGKDGKCTVTHFKKHWGHTIELQRPFRKRKRALKKIQSKEATTRHEDAKSDDEHFQISNPEEDDSRTVGKENYLAKVCNENSVNESLVKLKEETLYLLETVSALVETSMSVEEVLAAKNLLALIPPAVAAVQESRRADVFV